MPCGLVSSFSISFFGVLFCSCRGHAGITWASNRGDAVADVVDDNDNVNYVDAKSVDFCCWGLSEKG